MIRLPITVILLVFLIGCSKKERLPREHVDLMSVSVYLRPPGPADPGQLEQGGWLSGISFHASHFVAEPSGMWADGSPIERMLKVTRDEMLQILNVIERSDAISTVGHFWSPAKLEPKTPPPTDSERYQPARMEPTACRIKLIYTEGEYHRYIVMSLPWDDTLGHFLRALLDELPDRHIDELISTYERFRSPRD